MLSGEPGIGKSTLTLQIAHWFAQEKQQVLYVSGEEDVAQISDRAVRLSVQNQNISLVHGQDIESILRTLQTFHPALVIIDSVSVLYSGAYSSGMGSIQQIRHITEVCMEYAKTTHTAVILI